MIFMRLYGLDSESILKFKEVMIYKKHNYSVV